jgi:hypothetical protein
MFTTSKISNAQGLDFSKEASILLLEKNLGFGLLYAQPTNIAFKIKKKFSI